MNPLRYIYTKERRTFGRQPLFANRNQLLFSEQPQPELYKDYILKDLVDRGTQMSTQMAVSECNTERIKYVSRGMNHTEGGWPKDVNFADEEQTTRHRKKVERDDIWGQQVPALGKRVLKSVLQNNAVSIYENYFEDVELMEPPRDYSARIIATYRDPISPSRAVSHVSWRPTDPNRIVCTYSSMYSEKVEKNCDSYIWNVDNLNKPETTIKAEFPLISAEWNPRNEHIIGAGTTFGTVYIWDIRSGNKHVNNSIPETSHRERVTSLRWLHSKTNKEFFTGSSDGTVIIWDARNLSVPKECVIIDPDRSETPNRLTAHPVSVLEFEFTISTRYMLGTQLGYIFIGNRKAMSKSEELLARWPVMTGPVYSLVRNPVYVKYFLVVGDFGAKICVEECKDDCLIATKNHPCELRAGTWANGRCSLFVLGRSDGILEFWDLLMSQEKPIIEQRVSRGPVWSVECSENGKYIVVGTESGRMVMLELEEALTTSSRNEKNAVGAMFEREARRIKLLEGRMREINLKLTADESQRKKNEKQSTTKDSKGSVDPAETIAVDKTDTAAAIPGTLDAQIDAKNDTTVAEDTSENKNQDVDKMPEAPIRQDAIEAEIEKITNFFAVTIEKEIAGRKTKVCVDVQTPFDVKNEKEKSENVTNEKNEIKVEKAEKLVKTETK